MSITITPATTVNLVKTKLENDYKNQLTFANKQAQTSYFEGLTSVSFSDYTYVKKDSKIRVEANIDDIINYNYLYYENNFPTDKRYYCFITNMEYVNENCTDVYIETDVFQTYQFDITFGTCYVEREHTNDDTVGANTIPEGLETGEYIINKVSADPYNLEKITTNDKAVKWGYIVAASLNITRDNQGWHVTKSNFGKIFNGVYSSVYYYYTNSSSVLNDMLSAITTEGIELDNIKFMFVAPYWVCGENLSPVQNAFWDISQSLVPAEVNFTISPVRQIGNSIYGTYTPKNNKLYTGEYRYLLIDNGAGGTSKFNYEDFSNPASLSFNMQGILCEGCNIRLFPNNYKSNLTNEEANQFGMNLGKLPSINWTSDNYLTWLLQNQENISYQAREALISPISKTVAGGFTGGTAGAITGTLEGAANIFDTLHNLNQQIKMHSYESNTTLGNISSGNIAVSTGNLRFKFYEMTIKPEYARKIDDYFSVVGYKTNALKVPNITGRTNWNYVKCTEANIIGEIPDNDLIKLKDILRAGITFWHNPATMLDYSQTNNIVS